MPIKIFVIKRTMENTIIDFDSIKEEGLYLVPASKNKRFFNYIIDYVVIIIVYVGLLLVGLLELAEEGDSMGELRDRLILVLFYVSYYVLVEGTLKGKTIGKFITNTRTVNLDGSIPGFENILKRSFSRIVPFEVFSFLGNSPGGWHDKWSDTMVIDLKLSTSFNDIE